MNPRDLTDDERDAMAHCIGHASATGCSVHGGRNHYATKADDPMWRGLVERGLATMRRSSLLPDGEAVFRLTDAGVQAVEVDPRSRPSPPRGRLYEVRFRGYSEPRLVRAESRSKAKYRAIDLDLWPDGAGEAFKAIESCRLAGAW